MVKQKTQKVKMHNFLIRFFIKAIDIIEVSCIIIIITDEKQRITNSKTKQTEVGKIQRSDTQGTHFSQS